MQPTHPSQGRCVGPNLTRELEIIMAIHCMTMFLPTPLCLGASRGWCLGHDIPGLSRTLQSPESKLPSVGTGAGNSTKLQRRKNDQLIQYDSNCSELASLLLLVWWYINTTYWETEKQSKRNAGFLQNYPNLIKERSFSTTLCKRYKIYDVLATQQACNWDDRNVIE